MNSPVLLSRANSYFFLPRPKTAQPSRFLAINFKIAEIVKGG